MRRALTLLVLAGGVLVVALAAVSQTAAFRDWLRRQVLTRVNARTAGRLAVGSLEGNLFGGLVATDVRLVLEGQRVLAIRRLAATYDPFRLLVGGGLRITTLAADGVAVQLIADARGWNVERLAPASRSEPDADLDVTVETLRITSGALRIVRPERAWRLRGLTLAGSARFLPDAARFAVDQLAFTEQGSGLRLREARGRVAVASDGKWAVEDVHARTAGSELALQGRRGARQVDVHLSVLRLAAGELRAVLGARAPASDWRAELRAAGPDDAVVVTGEIGVEAASDGAVRPVGHARLAGTFDVREAVPVGELRTVLDHVDLAGILGPRLPASDLTGRLRLATRAAAPRAVDFTLELEHPRVAMTTLATVGVQGTADQERVAFEAAATATATAGTARLAGTIAPKGERFDLRLIASDLDPAVLTGRNELAGRMNGSVTLAGAGFAPATARADLALALLPSRIGAVAISTGALAARVEKGRLVVERARLVTNVGTAEGSGTLALGPGAVPETGGVQGDVRVTDLRPLAALLGRPDVSGAATVTIAAQGAPQALDVHANLTARGLAGAGWRAARIAGELDVQRFGDPRAQATMHARGHDVTLVPRRFDEVALGGWWQGRLPAARAGLDLQAREGASLQHQLGAEVAFGTEENRVTITTLRVDQPGQSWVATGTPLVVQRGDRVTIDDFVVRSARGSGRLRGVLARSGENDLELVLDGLDLEALRGLVPDDVTGRLGGHAHLGGTLAAPHLDADMELAAPTLGGVRYDELRARVDATAARVEVHGRLAQAAAHALVVDGVLPVRFALAPWRFEVVGDLGGRVRADGIDLAFLGSLWPGLVTKVGGTIAGEVTVGGSWAAPEARGAITLTGGRASIVPLGVTYDPVELEVRLEGRAASIGHVSIQSGQGSLTGGGDARLGAAGAVMDARFEARSFPLFANQYGRGAASGWLWISGSAAAPVLEGSLETAGLVLQIPEVSPAAAHQPDPTIVVSGPGAPAPLAPSSSAAPPPPVPGVFDRVAVTVQLAVPRDAWVRRSDANVELQGWMTAWKKPGEDVHLAGDIRGVRGWYAFQGKKFSLAEGSVRFSGQGLDPVLDITATHKTGEYLVRLRVGGTVTKPSLALESEPALDQADVLAVVLFGAPANQLSRSQSTGLREQALGIAGGYVAAELRQSVADALGVDDLQFETGTAGLGDASVSIGKYVADDIFVSLAHKFGAQSVEEVRIEYVIRPGWSLETSTDTLGKSGVDLFWKRRY